MNSIRKALAFAAAALMAAGMSAREEVKTENVDVRVAGDYLSVNADLVLDSMKLQSNHQVFITPVVTSDSVSVDFPSVLVSGRNMHLSYLRGVLKNFPEIKKHDIGREVERKNGKMQSVPYTARIPLEPWMKSKNVTLAFVYDSCGCGTQFGRRIGPSVPVFENPVPNMTARMLPAPAMMEVPIEKHEGRARIQFEVDRTELHVDPYKCRNGQRIDNRDQIAMIDDSVKYALTDPNVEIAEINICGYASPESPYLHNVELASGRSKALAEYLADRYSLPKGSVKYSSVPENWGEFREEVLVSNEISEEERKLLLELIDAPATTPEEYDHKEWMLKNDKRYSKLYKTKILPEWFPRLRATTFAIHTRLKPLDDQKLAEVIKTTPEKMSLNQMFRVANLYAPGSPEYNEVIQTALKYYPHNEIAIINAATAAVLDEDYETAKELLKRVDNSPEVYNLLGIIATAEERFDAAESYFRKAGTDDAERNLELLK
ncbi:MAG: DUF3868 domain-containing protein [Muribaculaceae bacterium]|nr:DUF3868 domain-containing protein [Muribaculaceae bacterium]